ncbi:thermonuclease family protein [Nocardioides pakistanensis]
MHVSHRFTAALAAVALTGTVTAVAVPAHAVGDKDCSDFGSQKAAQLFFISNGGPFSDPHRLDADGDGVVCESLPGPYYFGTSAPTAPKPAPKPEPKPDVLKQYARVIKVTDGDTIRVRLAGGARKNVRLIGIDTPEVHGGTECGGPQASRSLKQLLPLRTRVLLVSDPTQDRVDRYGRLLRYVMKNGKDINRAQVFRGWAEVYVYAGKPFLRTVGYRLSERKAKAWPRGIWKSCR